MRRYREARKQKNMKILDAANILGVSQPTLTSWENGTRNPPIDMLIKMAALYNVSVDFLLGLNSFPEGQMREICSDNISALAGRPVWVKRTGWALVNAERGQLLFADGHTESFAAKKEILIPWDGMNINADVMREPPLDLNELRQGLCIWLEPISDDPMLKEELRGRYRIFGHYAENERGNRFALDTYEARWLAYRVES